MHWVAEHHRKITPSIFPRDYEKERVKLRFESFVGLTKVLFENRNLGSSGFSVDTLYLPSFGGRGNLYPRKFLKNRSYYP